MTKAYAHQAFFKTRVGGLSTDFPTLCGKVPTIAGKEAKITEITVQNDILRVFLAVRHAKCRCFVTEMSQVTQATASECDIFRGLGKILFHSLWKKVWRNTPPRLRQTVKGGNKWKNSYRIKKIPFSASLNALPLSPVENSVFFGGKPMENPRKNSKKQGSGATNSFQQRHRCDIFTR